MLLWRLPYSLPIQVGTSEADHVDVESFSWSFLVMISPKWLQLPVQSEEVRLWSKPWPIRDPLAESYLWRERCLSTRPIWLWPWWDFSDFWIIRSFINVDWRMISLSQRTPSVCEIMILQSEKEWWIKKKPSSFDNLWCFSNLNHQMFGAIIVMRTHIYQWVDEGCCIGAPEGELFNYLA